MACPLTGHVLAVFGVAVLRTRLWTRSQGLATLPACPETVGLSDQASLLQVAHAAAGQRILFSDLAKGYDFIGWRLRQVINKRTPHLW